MTTDVEQLTSLKCTCGHELMYHTKDYCDRKRCGCKIFRKTSRGWEITPLEVAGIILELQSKDKIQPQTYQATIVGLNSAEVAQLKMKNWADEVCSEVDHKWMHTNSTAHKDLRRYCNGCWQFLETKEEPRPNLEIQ